MNVEIGPYTKKKKKERKGPCLKNNSLGPAHFPKALGLSEVMPWNSIYFKGVIDRALFCKFRNRGYILR